MPGKRPNFLVIMTDQQRGDALGCEGHAALLTPNMDHLAASGARFRRAYSTCPVCIPARRSFLSGQFPATHGMVGYVPGVPWHPAATLPGTLAQAGYRTAWVGRSMHQHPPRKRFGFHDVVMQDGIHDGDYERWFAKHAPPGAGGPRGAGITHNDWTARPWHVHEWLHYTNWTVTQAETYLRQRDRREPFFLVVSFLAPHPPLTPPAFYFDRYWRMKLPRPAIGDWATPPPDGGRGVAVDAPCVNLQGEALQACQAGYYGLINHVDDQLRRILNPVAGLVDEDTVIMLTSDHGEMLGDHYRFRKSLPYEGSARIPLLVRGGRQLGCRPGAVLDQPVVLEDLMPTVLDMAGVRIPRTVEGRSLLPLLRGERVAWRSYLHGEHAGAAHFLTDGVEKYIWFAADGREQLFDLRHDPRELRDLARTIAGRRRLARWRRRLVAQLRDRPEGFTDGRRLIAGRPYGGLVGHIGELSRRGGRGEGRRHDHVGGG